MANIGFDAKRAFKNFSGLGNYSRSIIHSLSNLYPENKYTLFTPDYAPNDLLSFAEKSNISIVKPQGLSQKLPSFYWRSFDMVSDIQFRHIDLFHGLSGELPLRTLSIPTVLTMHDVIFLRYPEFYHFWDRKIYEYKFRKACQSACKILAISHQTAEDAIHFLGADASKIEVIYQGCSPIFYRKSTPEDLESVKLKYQLPERFILSVGTIEERKNLINIIKALPLIDEEVSLVAIGRRTPYADAAEQVAEDLKVSSRLKMIHHAHFNDFPAIYAAAQMLVYPSFFEGFGLPVLEGLNIGIPVITSKISSLPEAGGPAAHYIDPYNYEDIANGITQILQHPDLAQSMVEKGHLHALKFREEPVCEQVNEIYNQLLH